MRYRLVTFVQLFLFTTACYDVSEDERFVFFEPGFDGGIVNADADERSVGHKPLDENSDTSYRVVLDNDVENALFVDDFEDATVFKELGYPDGDAHRCHYADGVDFSNDGHRHIVNTRCYDEALLQTDVHLPMGDYQIIVSWSTGADPHTFEDCRRTGFNDRFGASCTMPNRIVAINGKLIHEIAGKLINHSETTTIPYSGKIDTLTLGVTSAGSTEPYKTMYDFVAIRPL